MTSRLVLGCGSVGRELVLAVRDSAEWMLVLTEDSHRVETLRDEGIDAKRADVTDPEAVRSLAGSVDTVLIAGDESGRNARAAATARAVFPDAFVLAYSGADPDAVDVDALEESADSVVDPSSATADAVLERVGDDGLRTRRLRRHLRRLQDPLAIVTHDNPDPDAIASAVALRQIAESAGRRAEVCYYGEISHQENRAMVNLLDLDLVSLSPEDTLEYGSYALVDHARPGVNDQLPPETPVDVVIDHHPPRAPVEAGFVDLRSGVGATSTLLAGYLRVLNVDPDRSVATSLLFGIYVDTDDFTREASAEDFRAAAYLSPHADLGTLERIESPNVSADTLETIARAIVDRQLQDGVLVSCVRQTTDRDVLAQAADHLLDMEGVTTALVYGYTGTDAEDTVFVSARARGVDLDLGEVLRDAFGRIGSAGGHADMAGAQIPVGSLTSKFDLDSDESLESDRESVIREVITDRFLETLGVGLTGPTRPARPIDSFLGTRLEGFEWSLGPDDRHDESDES